MIVKQILLVGITQIAQMSVRRICSLTLRLKGFHLSVSGTHLCSCDLQHIIKNTFQMMQHTPQLVHSYNHITFQWRESVKK